MLCTFFGHRDTPDSIRIPLTAVLEYLIQNTGVQEFYVGNQGNFDRLVYQALENLKPVYSQITYHVVLPYLPQKKAGALLLFPGKNAFPGGVGAGSPSVCHFQKKPLDGTKG